MEASHPGRSRDLAALGWDTDLDHAFAAAHATHDVVPARVVREHRGRVVADSGTGEHLAAIAHGLADHPAVGDWVCVATPADGDPVVTAVLPRRTALVRRGAGESDQAQVVAANVDVVLITAPIDGPPKLRRIERELATAWTSGATPVVVLTKIDLADAPAAAVAAVEAVAIGVAVHPVDALSGAGVEAVADHLRAGRTGVLLGPSGAGKSTLANSLLGDETLETGAVRADGRGRHTTVARHLLALPSGGMLIDTPGVRSLGLWDAEEGVAATFADIEELAAQCRFADCAHDGEPGCAIRAAIAAGEVDAARVESWRKLLRELHWQATRTDARAKSEERKRWRVVQRQLRARERDRG